MKNKIQVSSLTVICAMCVAVVGGDAFAASSVRSLGGAGTYTSASSASEAKSSGSVAVPKSGVSRAGSVRVTPSTGRTGTTTSVAGNASTASGRYSSPRLSIGKYLGGGTSISGGSSAKPQVPGISGGGNTGGGMDTTLVEELQRTVDSLGVAVEDLNAAVEGKQDLLTTSDGLVEIDADTNEIYLNVENLVAELEGQFGSFDRTFEMQVADGWLQVKYEGETEWVNLVEVSALIGDIDLTQYVTKEEAQNTYLSQTDAENNYISKRTKIVPDDIAAPEAPDNREWTLIYSEGAVQWAPVVTQYVADAATQQ